jgi:hypothetical protein
MVLKGASQEAGVHIDGNYVKSLLGWRPRRLERVGEGGGLISSAEHKACYQNYWRHAHRVNLSSLQRWNGRFRGDAYIGGDCTRIQA